MYSLRFLKLIDISDNIKIGEYIFKKILKDHVILEIRLSNVVQVYMDNVTMWLQAI